MSGDPRSNRQWKALRLQVLHEQNWICEYCGGKATEVDHVVPIIERPDLCYVRTNCKASCHRCNAARENRRRHVPRRRKW